MNRAAVAVAISLGLAAAVVGGVLAYRRAHKDDAQCGAGFVAVGARCCVRPETCGAIAPSHARVDVPATTAVIGPSDWEAEGRVAPRALNVAAFALDAFEATVADIDASYTGSDGGRAATLSRDDAARFCASRGGRLPTEDEWIAAAAGASSRRYPWGDTGAVCRRAAWGLASGPCSHRGDGPDTVGAHPDGDTPSGIHDMAGNVAEWVVSADSTTSLGIARGGSWRTALAAELRTWSRIELDPRVKDDRVGVRCAYDR